jgi:uncharacterized membrane protein YhdT
MINPASKKNHHVLGRGDFKFGGMLQETHASSFRKYQKLSLGRAQVLDNLAHILCRCHPVAVASSRRFYIRDKVPTYASKEITMPWYWTAVLLGAVVAPWVLNASEIHTSFHEKGLVGGLRAWFGIALMTTPVVFIGFWLSELVLG